MSQKLQIRSPDELPKRGGAGNTYYRLILVFVLLSSTLSVCVLAARNLFDDEISSLPFVTQPVSEIVSTAQQGDVHPPGMYLFAHLALGRIRSYRWMSLLPLALWSCGLGLFLLNFMPPLAGFLPVFAGLVFAALHPELLMWSNTFRWYCPWTGLGLIALVLFLQPRQKDWALGWGRAIAGAVLLALMFYLNYITLLFVFALAVCLAGMYRRTSPGKNSLRPLLCSAVLFLALIAPQLPTMFAVHLENSRGQRATVLISSVRLVQAMLGSEAYVPWHPISLLAGVVSASLLICGASVLLKRSWRKNSEWSHQQALLVFGLFFMGEVALAGLGAKPRSAILLGPVLAPALSIGVATLRRSYQVFATATLVMWSLLGTAHLVGRFGLQKSSMNDKPEQVVRLIEREQRQQAGEVGNDRTCGLAIAYDGGVVLNLAQKNIPRLMILASDRGAMFAGTIADVPNWCSRPMLYIVQSYRSGDPERDWLFTSELKAAESFLRAPFRVDKLSPDPDAPLKRDLSSLFGLSAGESLPDYRFVVLSGEIERTQFPALRRTLHYFVSGDEVVSASPNVQARSGL